VTVATFRRIILIKVHLEKENTLAERSVCDLQTFSVVQFMKQIVMKLYTHVVLNNHIQVCEKAASMGFGFFDIF